MEIAYEVFLLRHRTSRLSRVHRASWHSPTLMRRYLGMAVGAMATLGYLSFELAYFRLAGPLNANRAQC